jgi:hypothetical protein
MKKIRKHAYISKIIHSYSKFPSHLGFNKCIFSEVKVISELDFAKG